MFNSFQKFGWLVSTYTTTEKELIGIERINQFLKNKTESFSKDTSSSAIQKGELVFDRVCMTYDPDKPPALNDISFKCTKGNKIAVCGRTGSGKSTILNCAIGLYKTNKGRILIDGQPKSFQELKNLRKHIVITLPFFIRLNFFDI